MQGSVVKAIIFDYGGTLDCRGDHWAVIIRRAWQAAGLDVPLDDFCRAYIYGERALAAEGVVAPTDTFLELMRRKAAFELECLGLYSEELAEAIAQYCYRHARECTAEAAEVLQALGERYRLALVSNFYGNLKSVLADFGLLQFFPVVVESASVGVRKPDPRIFGLALEALGIEPAEALVVGDSVSKDILPAQSLGCEAVLIKGEPWFYEKEQTARCKAVKSLKELLLPC